MASKLERVGLKMKRQIFKTLFAYCETMETTNDACKRLRILYRPMRTSAPSPEQRGIIYKIVRAVNDCDTKLLHNHLYTLVTRTRTRDKDQLVSILEEIQSRTSGLHNECTNMISGWLERKIALRARELVDIGERYRRARSARRETRPI